MGMPADEFNSLYDWVGVVIRDSIRDNYTKDARILDVGAGWGKFAKLLPEYKLDACEVWETYKPNLETLYTNVFIEDICDLDLEYYDAVIMSEVVEHIDRPVAIKLIKKLAKKCDQLYISVPYLHPQDEVDGNPYEIHKQDDLTPEIMRRDYPTLRPLLELKRRGLYVKK